jgi:putative membrane protein
MITFYVVLLAVGVVLLVVTVVRVLVGGLDDAPGHVKSRTRTSSRARQILDERYAAGELSDEEYEHRVRVLEEGIS